MQRSNVAIRIVSVFFGERWVACTGGLLTEHCRAPAEAHGQLPGWTPWRCLEMRQNHWDQAGDSQSTPARAANCWVSCLWNLALSSIQIHNIYINVTNISLWTWFIFIMSSKWKVYCIFFPLLEIILFCFTVCPLHF